MILRYIPSRSIIFPRLMNRSSTDGNASRAGWASPHRSARQAPGLSNATEVTLTRPSCRRTMEESKERHCWRTLFTACVSFRPSLHLPLPLHDSFLSKTESSLSFLPSIHFHGVLQAIIACVCSGTSICCIHDSAIGSLFKLFDWRSLSHQPESDHMVRPPSTRSANGHLQLKHPLCERRMLR